MATYITMPKLGLTMTEGLVVRWLKNEGDQVTPGEALVEVSTDKISNEVEAEVGGVLKKILVEEGQTVPVSAELAIIAAENEEISLSATEEKVPEKNEVPLPEVDKQEKIAGEGAKEGKDGFIKASPAAKKYARDKGIDLSLVTGTGPQGRIVERDVINFANTAQRKVKTSPLAEKVAKDLQVDLTSIAKEARIMKEDVLTSAKKTNISPEERVVPTTIRRVIAERMTESWHVAPMVTLHLETDVTELKILRNNLQKESSSKGVKISYNDILIKICGKALMEFPMANASYDGKEYILHADANIGLAISLDGGLIVPNVKDVQNKSILEISRETNSLIAKARDNKLGTEEITGGTFTISNLGMFGINYFTPIINQPEAAILGVNAIVERPVVIEGEVKVRPLMNLSLTFDHRILDGADAAKFLSRIKELIENPALLLL